MSLPFYFRYPTEHFLRTGCQTCILLMYLEPCLIETTCPVTSCCSVGCVLTQFTLHWIVYIFQLDITEEDCFSLFPLETLVYLTPDSEHGMYFTACIHVAHCIQPFISLFLGSEFIKATQGVSKKKKEWTLIAHLLWTETSLNASYLSCHVHTAAQIQGLHPQLELVSYLVILMSFPCHLLTLILLRLMLDKYFFPRKSSVSHNFLFYCIKLTSVFSSILPSFDILPPF